MAHESPKQQYVKKQPFVEEMNQESKKKHEIISNKTNSGNKKNQFLL